jgi:hypothetical protein
MPILPMTQRSVVVKNTFIEEKDEESRELLSIHAQGANTCVARLSTDSCKLSDWCSDDDMSQASTPSMCDRARSGLSEGTFVSTPTGSECSFPLCDGELTKVATRAMPCGEQSLSTLPVPKRQIWLNIPVEVPYDDDYSPDDFQFTVTSTVVNRDSGCASIDVKVSLNNNRKVLPLAMLVPDSRTCAVATEQLSTKSQVVVSPLSQLSDKVCCHWKNKGWCKYQECCKFQHPAHKRGVGSTKRA